MGGGNPWLAPMFVGVSLVLAAVLVVPYLRGVMGFAAISVPPLLAAFGLLLACGLWLQMLWWANSRRLRWAQI
ncbi:MAG: hypothetical protein ACYDEV_12795 [Acidiferrobacter sp.]